VGDGGVQRWRRRSDRYWLLAALCGFGLTTWAGFLYIGVRSGRRAWRIAAGLYGVAAVALAYLAATRSDLPVLVEWLLLLALWAGGSVHAVVAHRRWLAWLATSSSPAVAGGLEEPWATFVRRADSVGRRFRAAAEVATGPHQDAVRDLVADVDRSVVLVHHLAGHGQVLVTAWQGLDVEAVDAGLAAGREALAGRPDEPGHQVVEALEAQRAAADRVNEVIAVVAERLRLVDTRLVELLARVEELARPGVDPDAVLVDLRSIRGALDEVAATALPTPFPLT
jgi:hypothetical protein